LRADRLDQRNGQLLPGEAATYSGSGSVSEKPKLRPRMALTKSKKHYIGLTLADGDKIGVNYGHVIGLQIVHRAR